MTKAKEYEVPYPELQPFKKSRKKDIKLDFITMRLEDSDGCEGLFEQDQEQVQEQKKK